MGIPATIEDMLSTIITISPDTSTLEGIRNFVYEAARFGLPPTTLLLDGGHVAPAHASTLHLTKQRTMPTIAKNLRIW